MSNGDLTDQYIDDTFDGLLHVNGQPLPVTGVVDVFDGVGNESALSVGRSGNGVSVSGSSTVDGSLRVTQSMNVLGQLTANNVTYPTSSTSKSLLNILLNATYPIGSVYFSTRSTSPESLFGGTWDRIAEGRFIVGVGTGTDSDDLDKAFGVGNTGGQYRQTLTTKQIPGHSHKGYGLVIAEEGDAIIDKINNPWDTLKGKTGILHKSDGHNSVTFGSSIDGTRDSELIINDAGGGESHNNTPPGFGLYVYTRTA